MPSFCEMGTTLRQLKVVFSGRVQGVGFRYTVRTLAAGFDATGIVRNLPDGRVEFIAEGEPTELEAFLEAIRVSEVGRFIRHEEENWQDAMGRFRGFEIVR
jgi:acylphosphatase